MMYAPKGKLTRTHKNKASKWSSNPKPPDAASRREGWWKWLLTHQTPKRATAPTPTHPTHPFTRSLVAGTLRLFNRSANASPSSRKTSNSAVMTRAGGKALRAVSDARRGESCRHKCRLIMPVDE